MHFSKKPKAIGPYPEQSSKTRPVWGYDPKALLKIGKVSTSQPLKEPYQLIFTDS